MYCYRREELFFGGCEAEALGLEICTPLVV